jgi:hypothetical protein
MQTITHELSLSAAPEITFAFLSNIDNMPLWSTRFCSGIERRNGLTVLHTAQGPMPFTLVSDTGTGVIDFVGGPTPAQVIHWHGRVLRSPTGGSIFLFTAVLQPGQVREELAAQCELLEEEFDNVRAALDGAGGQATAA